MTARLRAPFSSHYCLKCGQAYVYAYLDGRPVWAAVGTEGVWLCGGSCVVVA